MFKLFGFFLLFYLICLAMWLSLKAPYQSVINTVAFKTSAWIYDIKMLNIEQLSDQTTLITATNSYASIDLDGKDSRVVFDITLDIDAITFNVPMTLALLLAIITTLKTTKKQKVDALINGMALLAALHFVTMFIVCISLIIGVAEQSDALSTYLQHRWMPRELLINLGSFLSSYAARFEPFLIAVLIWWSIKSKEEQGVQATSASEPKLPSF